jgi:hypothetical protein
MLADYGFLFRATPSAIVLAIREADLTDAFAAAICERTSKMM